MDYWTHKGRPILLAALEAACDSVEENLAVEIQQRYEKSHESLLKEVGRLQAAAERVDSLEKENQSLVRELGQLRSRQETLPPPAARPALAKISANTKLGSLAADPSKCGPEKATDWEKEFSKLAVRHATLERRQEEIHRSARRFRAERDSWTEYAQSLEVKIEKLEKKVQRNKNADDRVPPSSSAKPRPTSVNQLGPSSDRIVVDSSTVSEPDQAINPKPRGDPTRESMGVEEVTPTPATLVPGSPHSTGEETQDGSDGVEEMLRLPQGAPTGSAVRIKEEPSSDAPVIVSERTIRKRKHTDDDVGMPAPPRRIKSEQSTSSEPVITGEAPIFCPHESIDLDEDERGMPTPRKQQQWENRHALREDKDVAPPEQRLGGARSTEEQPHGLGLHLDRPTAAALSPHRPSRAHKDREPPIRTGWTLDSGIADVAEETFESFYSLKPRQAEKGPTHQTPLQGRLHSLLNDNSPKKSGVFLSPARLRHGSASPRLDKENVENRTAQETEESSDALVKPPPIVSASTVTPLRKHGQDKGKLPKPGRLRDRPLAGLRPEDFKVNPRSNNGYNHAFDEVVRNREERAELSGCTDPNCCGRQFRAMAESELSAGGPGVLSRVADIKMMENYLGTEADQLVEMTRGERQETWLKARIQDLANRLGRHRHRFARRPSPPGYWNPDFPSTQEIEKNKEEAERAERELVEQRWREAMRGGRWLFRDE
ncbi:DNA repair protein endonuclease SAE2/CtIP C-terminus-domain-containing protein [Chaetomium fimeti]|uniref:DNA repair protein endonuclease SAE2/CtIP C-terminus-domain-containing protein n=1 Tax=Chaetomium fimeti TaxID=1854472 RepID=A0AAE0LU09_9PEZI|nr:DNA repair protein endonuclease SAE2/CtIP C-terminus-domain-containing protein [Chaetomium fimeti]